jgi:tetratricopeptide (TPR) repeat protein
MPVRMETLRKRAICEYRVGDFSQALQALKHIYGQQPWNLEILFEIATINQENLKDDQEALKYFTLGKDLFKKNQTSIYGRAFELVMDPKDAPEIYYHLFIGRAKANLNLNNFAEAETDCNWATFLRPMQGEGFKLRVLAKVNQQNYRGVCADLAKAIELGATDTSELKKKYCSN